MNLKKIKFILFIFLFGFLISNICVADSIVDPTSMTTQELAFNQKAGFNPANIGFGGIVATIITALLGLLGIVFVVLMIYAGFLWMTAHGNEEQVKKAMGIIQTAVIGLVIVIAAYSITFFVFNALGGASGGGGKPQTGG